MRVDTHGKIKGYIRHEEILNYIHQKWDKHAKSEIKKTITCPISECDWEFEINEHSEDSENWYSYSGFIYFQYHNQNISLFYDYDNLKHLEDIEDYLECGLEDMINTETTYLSFVNSKTHIELMKELIFQNILILVYPKINLMSGWKCFINIEGICLQVAFV